MKSIYYVQEIQGKNNSSRASGRINDQNVDAIVKDIAWRIKTFPEVAEKMTLTFSINKDSKE